MPKKEYEYHLKPGKVGEKVIGAYKKTEQAFTEAFLQKDETSPSGYSLKTGKTGEAVTGAYHKIEDGVVGTYKKIEDAFVDRFLEKTENDFRTQTLFPKSSITPAWSEKALRGCFITDMLSLPAVGKTRKSRRCAVLVKQERRLYSGRKRVLTSDMLCFIIKAAKIRAAFSAMDGPAAREDTDERRERCQPAAAAG